MSQGQNPLLLRLRQCGQLGAEDEGRLLALLRPARDVNEGHDLEWQGRPPGEIQVLLDGLACRFKLLPDGRRQILDFLVPGDTSDLAPPRRLEQGICTLAPSRVAAIPRDAMAEALAASPALERVFAALTVRELALMRERLVSLGRRDAYERVAHLLWELYLRFAGVELAGSAERGFSLRLGQLEIADALGLSSVYVSRTIQRLRRHGAVEYEGRRIRIADLERLREIADSGADPPSLQHLGPAAAV